MGGEEGDGGCRERAEHAAIVAGNQSTLKFWAVMSLYIRSGRDDGTGGVRERG